MQIDELFSEIAPRDTEWEILPEKDGIHTLCCCELKVDGVSEKLLSIMLRKAKPGEHWEQVSLNIFSMSISIPTAFRSRSRRRTRWGKNVFDPRLRQIFLVGIRDGT